MKGEIKMNETMNIELKIQEYKELVEEIEENYKKDTKE